MKIAISGAHRTGKTTLVAELGRGLASFASVAEPYELLADDGHEFAAPPSLEDFEMQLARSIESIVETVGDGIFDRCPADVLAYLLTHRDASAFDLEQWLPRVRAAMERIDLVVFVPVEQPDRIPAAELEHARWRRRVDEELREIVLDDRWSFGVEALEVTGTARERARQVLARIDV